MNKIVVFMADGVEECEALITVDLLRRAGIETVIASISETLRVVSSHNIAIITEELAWDIDFSSVDAVFLPGGAAGVERLAASPLVREQCLAFAAQGKIVSAICAAPSLLAGLGILDGRTATVHPSFEHKCPAAKLTHTKTARDGNIITGQAVGGTFEFALELIGALLGYEEASRIRRSICL